MYERLGHLHFVTSTWDWASRWWHNGTPTTIAMRRSQRFIVFRSVLADLGVDLQEFIRNEVDLVGDGWTQTTMAALFADNYRDPALGDIPCVQCKLMGSWIPPKTEPLWEQRVDESKLAETLEDHFLRTSSACKRSERHTLTPIRTITCA